MIPLLFTCFVAFTAASICTTVLGPQPDGYRCYFNMLVHCQSGRDDSTQVCKNGCIDSKCYDPRCVRQAQLEPSRAGSCQPHLQVRSNELIESYVDYVAIVALAEAWIQHERQTLSPINASCLFQLAAVGCHAYFPSCNRGIVSCLDAAATAVSACGLPDYTSKCQQQARVPLLKNEPSFFPTAMILFGGLMVGMLLAVGIGVLLYRRNRPVAYQTVANNENPDISL